MKSITFILLLSAATAENMSVTCRNLTLDPTIEVLSGECNDGQGDNAAWQPTSLDLNRCLGYNATQATILWKDSGNFGSQCDGCSLFETLDPIWRVPRLNIGCTCSGAEASFNIDDSNIDNKYGTLVCS